jgi:glycosyltransferase involved in cell wall biosynthesis
VTRANRRLVLLTTSLSWGGAQVQLVRLARELKRRGWDVGIISMLEPELFSEELESTGIRVASLKMQRGSADLGALARAVVILRRWRPAVLCSFLYHANLLGRVAGRLAGIPVIVSSIRNENFGGSTRDRIVRLTNWASHAVTTNSRLAATKLAERRVVAGDRVRVIPNSIVVSEFERDPDERYRLRGELGVGEDEFLWVAVGRLDMAKDYPTLLAAVERLVAAGQPTALRVAGDGPLRGALEVQVRDLGLEERVAFLGPRRDCPALYGAADGFVLSSLWEGLPNVIMEALAAGTPVVATRVGGVGELVEDGQSGFLVPPRDAPALVDAMRRLMDTPVEERMRMGLRGRAHMEREYGVESITDMWESLYEDLYGRVTKEAV